MEIGTNKIVNSYLRMISPEDKMNLDYYFFEMINKSYNQVDSDIDVRRLLTNEMLSDEESSYIMTYSSFRHEAINAALRGTWSYEQQGNEDINKYREIGEKVKSIISNNPTILSDDIVVYRGVNLDYFKQYGICDLEELELLQGQYMLDQGLVSTSLKVENSFYRKNYTGRVNNVLIEYMIPKEFCDGRLLDCMTTYRPEEKEYLINASNLGRVSSVVINKDNTAEVRVGIIPKELYDDYYKTKK